MMAKAYSYIRFSTDIQSKGDSLRRQLEISENYAKDNGLELIESFRDVGISAFKSKNLETELGRFLDAVKNGDIEEGSYLLVENFDRLSRANVFDAFGLFSQIINNGINIVTLSDNKVYTKDKIHESAHDILLSLLYMIRANEESRIKSERVRAAWNNKRNSINNRALTSKTPAWLKLNKQTNKLEIIEDHTNTINLIFDKTIEGYGAISITRRLNESNVKSIGKTKHWNKSYVTKILSNRQVLGEFQPHTLVEGKRIAKGDVIFGYYPQIVSNDKFFLAQDAIKNRLRKGGRKGNTLSNLFSHLLKCRCGGSYVYINTGKSSKSGKDYLICSHAYHKTGCIERKWVYKDFETMFFKFITELDINSILSNSVSELNIIKSNILALEREISNLKNNHKSNKDKFSNSLLNSTLSDEEFAFYHQAFHRSEEIIKEKISTLNNLQNKALNLESDEYVNSQSNLLALKDLSTNCTNDEELYRIRLKLQKEISKIIDNIVIQNPSFVMIGDLFLDHLDKWPKELMDIIYKSGATTKRQISKFIDSKQGQTLFQNYASRITIFFKNGEKTEISDFLNMRIDYKNNKNAQTRIVKNDEIIFDS